MSLWSFSAGARRRGVPRLILGLACCFLGVLLLFAPGCNKRRRNVETAEVTGQVLLDGKPVTGGIITFVASDGYPSNGVIDENGNYKVRAPVGEVSIGVDNSMLRPKRRGAPTNIPHPKGPPGGEAADSGAVKGSWMNIPSRYADPTASGLKYTVKSGAQTHPVELSGNLLPPPPR